MYTISLANGEALDNLELNGNNYIAPSEIDSAIFEGNLDTVRISDGENEETYTDMVLLSNIVRDGKSWLVFGQKTEADKLRETIDRLEAQLAYVSLMTGFLPD